MTLNTMKRTTGRLLTWLRDPQSWISTIAVLTVVGLSSGAFEVEEVAPQQSSALHLNGSMTNDAVLAELRTAAR